LNKDLTLYVISVLAPDRRGIIADVSDVIYGLGGNLEATSQTIMQGWFTMLIGAWFPISVREADVKQALGHVADIEVLVRRTPKDMTTAALGGDPYVVICDGDDKPGIVRGLSRCCASKGVNIDDVWNEVREGRFITVFHVTVPQDVDPKDFRQDLENVAATLGVALTLQHQDIFTATNSLQVHTKRR